MGMASIIALMRDPSALKQKVKSGTAKRMLRFAVPYAGLLAVFLAVVILGSAIGILNPLIYRHIVDYGILKGSATLVIRFSVLAAVVGLLDNALGLAQSYLSAVVGARIVLALRTRLFEHIQQMPLAFFTRVQTGALMSRLSTDVTGAQIAFTEILSSVVGNTVTLVLVLGAMFALSWRITIAALVLVPLFILPARFWGRKLQGITRESFNLAAAMNSLMVERFNVAGAHLAKLFGRPLEDGKVFADKAKRVSDIGVKQTIYSRLLFSAFLLTASLATTFVYGWGGLLIVQHRLDLGTVVALVAYLGRLNSTVMGLSSLQVNLMTALVSFERVFEVLDLRPMIQDDPNAVAIPSGPVRVAFDGVSFRYPSASEVSLASLQSISVPEGAPEKFALTDITFVAEAGQLLALVGPSGAGKTTISQLVGRDTTWRLAQFW